MKPTREIAMLLATPKIQLRTSLLQRDELRRGRFSQHNLARCGARPE